MNSFTLAAPLAAIPLCSDQGQLNPQAIGWSPRPLVDCAIPGHYGRRKRWNHWCITTPDWMLSLTQADLDYLGYAAAYFLDLQSGQACSFSQFRLFGFGSHLPDHPQQSHEFNHPRLQLRVAEHTGRTRITVNALDIGGQALNVALDIQRPGDRDSVNLVAPMGPRGFHATCRELGIAFVPYSPLGRGFLTGRFTSQDSMDAADYRRMTPRSFLPLDFPLYAGASLERGRAWNNDNEFDSGYINAASIFLGFDTPLGPLNFSYGFNDDNQKAVYLNLGQTF